MRTPGAGSSSSPTETLELSPGLHEALLDVLGDARRLGHIGPGSLDEQIDRSLALTGAFSALPAGPIVDLGSGGGLPGLVLAAAWPASAWVLVDGRELRAAFLTTAVERLGWSDRVSVIGDRAERTGRGSWRGQAGAVVARGFGPPAVTAECAAPLLAVGGRLVVTEPPGGAPDRWDPSGLAELGLVTTEAATEPVAWQAFRQERPCPDRYPRRVGVPAKQPLWG